MGSIPIAGSFSARSIGTYGVEASATCQEGGQSCWSRQDHHAPTRPLRSSVGEPLAPATLASRLAHSAADPTCRDCNPPPSGGGAMLCELCAPIETGPAGQAREIWNVCVHRGLVLATEELLQGRKVPPSTLTLNSEESDDVQNAPRAPGTAEQQ